MRVVAFTGAQAAAFAMRQISPEVVAAYPITPQTEIMEQFADYVADGDVDSELICVESEHSAMSAVIGASAAGVRAMTATSSQGLALMFEMVNIASGLRLPIVMNVVNRALSAPINIHCDHSDSMACRDSSWIQIYSENVQEVYENTLLALKLAESVLLPVMVMQDGFITSHCVENMRIYEDSAIKRFIREPKKRDSLLDIDAPKTFGPLQLFDYFFEAKRQQADAMEKAMPQYLKVGNELSRITGNHYPYFEEYCLKDAKAVIVTMSSAAGTAKEVVDRMREKGKKVGLLKIRLFRPFPYNEIAKALRNANAVAVLDRAESFGANPPVFGEVKASLYGSVARPRLQSCVFGLGGRELLEDDIEMLFSDMLKSRITQKIRYIGLR